MEGQVLDAPNALAQAIRLQQLAGAYGEWDTYKDDEGKTKSNFQHADPSSKTDELIQRLNGLGRAVVFTRFRNRAEFVAERIRQETDMEVLLMVGGLGESKQKEYLDRFLDVGRHPDPLVAVCVYGTISEGVNELVASRDIFLLDWYTAKDAVQAVDRLDRPGIKHASVRATVLYSEGTIDELMIDRSSMRVLPLKEVLRTPDAYAFLLNPIDTQIEE
jgi:ERCC4-related helicase